VRQQDVTGNYAGFLVLIAKLACLKHGSVHKKTYYILSGLAIVFINFQQLLALINRFYQSESLDATIIANYSIKKALTIGKHLLCQQASRASSQRIVPCEACCMQKNSRSTYESVSVRLMFALRDDRRGVVGDSKGRGTRVWSP